jgi:DNA-binding NtrC family response regulator
MIGPDTLPEQVLEDRQEALPAFPVEQVDGLSLSEIVEEFEKRVNLDMLSRTNWSQTEAADRFKIPLSTLNQKIKRLRIDVKQHRKG